MFLGHFALAFGAKRLAPTVSLGTLFLACQLADLLWPTFLLFGLERVEIDPGNTVVTPLNFVSYPYSHSLVMLIAWSVVFAIAYLALKGASAIRAATIVGALVLSHFVLDLIMHRPDLPITVGGATKLGFGLWNHPGATLAVESAMFLLFTAVYMGATRARDAVGRGGLWALIVVLVAIYFAALYGPPPPNSNAIAIAGHLTWLFVIWAYWIDRHRAATR